MAVLRRFGVHVCITFWVELNVNKVYISQATVFVAVAACIQNCIFKMFPLVIFGPPCCENLVTGLTAVNVTEQLPFPINEAQHYSLSTLDLSK